MPYDRLYAAREDNILWGNTPGRLVARIKEFMDSGTVLDIGCGDGKNALFLEQQGFSVVGFDKSALALQGLSYRFKRARWKPTGTYAVKDIENEKIDGSYDALISYGLFHCLNNKIRIEKHRELQALVKNGGYLFFACLTDELPFPSGHGTEPIDLATQQELEQLFAGWKMLFVERTIIQEDHLPVVGEHKHAAIRIIARKE